MDNIVQNKKYFTVVSIVAVIIIITTAVFVWLFFYKNITDKPGQESEMKDRMAALSELLPKVECSFSSDQEAYDKAIESSNINACECVKEGNLKEVCKNVAFDLNSYMEAIKQYNPDLCNEIQDDSRKQACLTIASSGVDHLKKEDPQHLAEVYFQTQNYGAIQELEKLLQEDPNNVGNLVLLALSYAGKGLKEQEQGRDQTPSVEKALEVIEKAKAIAPDDPEVYRAEAYIYEIKPDLSLAIEIYGRSIDLDANNISAYVGRGHAENMLGMLDEALADFKKAAQLDPKKENMSVYANLCRLESSRGDLLEEAIGNCKIVADSVSASTSSKSEAYQILAIIYQRTKNYSQAENYLLKARVLAPSDSKLYLTLAGLMIAQERYPEAQIQAEKAISLSPTKSSSYQALAYSLYKQGKNQEAIDSANKGLTLIEADVSLLAPNKSAAQKELYYILANIYNRTGDKENEMKFKGLGESTAVLKNDTIYE